MIRLKETKSKVFALTLLLTMTVSSVPSEAAVKTDIKRRNAEKKETVLEAAEDAKTEEAETEEAEEENTALYSAEDLKFQGVIWYENHKYTWYSEKVLPGPGLNIPGRHVDENGYVCDEDDFICIATRDYEKGTEIDIPFGKKGKVYDWCPTSGTIDVYVSW